MRGHEGRHGNRCEQCVIDRLVVAVAEGDATAKSTHAQMLLDAYAERRWRKFDVLATGLFLRASALAVSRVHPREIAIHALSSADVLERGPTGRAGERCWIHH